MVSCQGAWPGGPTQNHVAASPVGEEEARQKNFQVIWAVDTRWGGGQRVGLWDLSEEEK